MVNWLILGLVHQKGSWENLLTVHLMRQQLLYVTLAVLHHYREILDISLFLWRHLSYPVISQRKLTVARGKKEQKFAKILQMHRAFRCGCWSGECAPWTSCLECSYAQGLHAGFTLARTGCPKSEGKCETAGQSLRLPHRTLCLVNGCIRVEDRGMSVVWQADGHFFWQNMRRITHVQNIN